MNIFELNKIPADRSMSVQLAHPGGGGGGGGGAWAYHNAAAWLRSSTKLRTSGGRVVVVWGWYFLPLVECAGANSA